MKYFLILIFSLFTLNAYCGRIEQNSKSDAKLLERALDYLASEKYHEALLILIKLDKKYNLNPRFKAYIGVCYFYEFDYEKACAYLDGTINQLNVYSPTEQCVYYNVAAESHFMLNNYIKAIPYYEKKLLVCKKDEKGDTYYKLGFCHMFTKKWKCAIEYFKSALIYYNIYHTNYSKSRIMQLKRMIKGCEEKSAIQE